VPIRIRLALAFAIATLVLVAVGGVLFERSFRRGLEDSLDSGLRTQADSLAVQVRDTPAPDLRTGGRGALLDTHDVVAQVLDPSGRVLAATREAGPRPVISGATARTARARTVFTDTRVGAERERYRVLARSVSGSEGVRTVVVASSLESTDDAVGRVRDALLVGGSLAVLVAAAGGWVLATAALRPVERMRRQAADISEHDSDSRLEVPPTRDEIAALAVTMNDLLGRLHAAVDRQRAFVADAGHELRTPLAVLRTELELAGRRERTPAELRDAIDHAAQESERLSRLADELLFLTRADGDRDRIRRERVQLRRVLEQAVESIRARAVAADVALVVDAGATEVSIAPDLVRRAVENLLENALRYSPPGSTIEVRGRCEAATVTIEVGDEGPGFPAGFVPHAFERFSRADDSRARADGGTGLGLAIVLAVARAHGGSAEVAGGPAGGALVTVRLADV
jgi:hypothetical protein